MLIHARRFSCMDVLSKSICSHGNDRYPPTLTAPLVPIADVGIFFVYLIDACSFRISVNADISSSTLIGLAIWQFMPAL